jgi:hypothetical protein
MWISKNQSFKKETPGSANVLRKTNPARQLIFTTSSSSQDLSCSYFCLSLSLSVSLSLFFSPSDPTPKMEVAPSQRQGSLGGDKLIWQPYPLAFLSDVSPCELPIGARHKSGS